MRAADLQTELSDYENTAALRNALKSTALFQRFPTFPHAAATGILSSGSETQIVSQLSKPAKPGRPKYTVLSLYTRVSPNDIINSCTPGGRSDL